MQKKAFSSTEKIRTIVDKRIEKNTLFLKNFTFETSKGELCSLYDSTMNANIRPDLYFSEVNNRVNSIFKIAYERDLSPVFLTITLPPEFHFNSKNYNNFTPRESALYLSDVWHKFMKLSLFRKIRKFTNESMIYIRTYEPHKDGTPHMHAMLFVPSVFINELKSKFYEHYQKFNFRTIGLKFITDFTHAKYNKAKGAIAYILKYMNKTFKNAKINKMTDEAYWFAYYRIRRFITSQTLIPIWIYRKIKYLKGFRSLVRLTDYYKGNLIYHDGFDGKNSIGRVWKCIYYRFFNYKTKEPDEKVLYFENPNITEQLSFKTKVYQSIPKAAKKIKNNKIKVYDDKNRHIANLIDNRYIPLNDVKIIKKMADYELYRYYLDLDIEKVNLHHYGLVKNELIDRQIIKENKINLNDYNDLFDI